MLFRDHKSKSGQLGKEQNWVLSQVSFLFPFTQHERLKLRLISYEMAPKNMHNLTATEEVRIRFSILMT